MNQSFGLPPYDPKEDKIPVEQRILKFYLLCLLPWNLWNPIKSLQKCEHPRSGPEALLVFLVVWIAAALTWVGIIVSIIGCLLTTLV